jgi:hypothetical protein
MGLNRRPTLHYDKWVRIAHVTCAAAIEISKGPQMRGPNDFPSRYRFDDRLGDYCLS